VGLAEGQPGQAHRRPQEAGEGREEHESEHEVLTGAVHGFLTRGRVVLRSTARSTVGPSRRGTARRATATETATEGRDRRGRGAGAERRPGGARRPRSWAKGLNRHLRRGTRTR